jgi:hypothetical protein
MWYQVAIQSQDLSSDWESKRLRIQKDDNFKIVEEDLLKLVPQLTKLVTDTTKKVTKPVTGTTKKVTKVKEKATDATAALMTSVIFVGGLIPTPVLNASLYASKMPSTVNKCCLMKLKRYVVRDMPMCSLVLI